MASADTATKTREKIKIKAPGKFKVIVLNDDHTPMDFVVALFVEIFKHQQDAAIELTMKIHNEGSAIGGVYTYEIAEQKGLDATNLAREYGHPLVIKVEAE